MKTGGIKNLPIDNIYKISEALEIDTAYFTDPEYESKEQTDNSPSSFSRLSREIHRKELSQFIDSAIQILAPTLLRKEYSVLELNRGPFDLEAKNIMNCGTLISCYLLQRLINQVTGSIGIKIN